MEPRIPMPGPSPEMGGYQRREVQPITPEQAPKPASVEEQPRSGERSAEATSNRPSEPVVIPAVPAQPFLPAPVQSASAVQPVPNNGNPAVAGDDDLIEKEWVDKAKKIVAETRNDPYMQEKEVSKLQADYIKKRYGKDVKLAND